MIFGRSFGFALAGTIAAACAIGVTASPQLADVSPDLVREKAIAYFDRQATDPAGALSRRLRAGEIKLRVDETFGYLPAILDALHVPIESQILTYGRNSIQALNINPRNPRAIYFNDSVIVEAPFLIVDGVLQCQDGVTSIRAEQVHGMKGLDIDFDAHDFY